MLIAGSRAIPAAGRPRRGPRAALAKQFAQHRAMATALVGTIAAHREIGLMGQRGENIQVGARVRFKF
jgi:hypothetical protein